MLLTYLGFHLVFVLPPLAALLSTASFPLAGRPRVGAAGVAVLTGLALVYTTPWDNHLIASGVWSYPADRILARIWHAPVGEYLFIVLQPLLTALWLYRLPSTVPASLGVSRPQRLAGAAAGLAVGLAGWLVLSAGYYLGTLLLWASPVLALQWGVGWPVLWRLRRRLAVAVWVPTAYLCVADRIAIELGIWRFDHRFMTGLDVLGLPVEEAAFFLLTNLFVVQGLLLFFWVIDRWG